MMMSQSALNQEVADLKLTLQQTQQGIIYTLIVTFMEWIIPVNLKLVI